MTSEQEIRTADAADSYGLLDVIEEITAFEESCSVAREAIKQVGVSTSLEEARHLELDSIQQSHGAESLSCRKILPASITPNVTIANRHCCSARTSCGMSEKKLRNSTSVQA